MRPRTPVLPLVLLLVAASACAPARAQEPPTGAAALAASGLSDEQRTLLFEIIAAQKSVTTVQGTFTETSRRADEPDLPGDVQKATFALQAPDKYSVEVSKPSVPGYRERFASDGETRVHVTRLDEEDPAATETEPAKNGRDDVFKRVLNFIQLQDPAAVRDFAFTPERTADGARLTLTPRGGEVADQVKTIVIDLDKDLRTKRIRFDDPQGNRVEIAIDAARYNETIPAEAFRQP